jgi:ABC-type transport system substrate-binding protein
MNNLKMWTLIVVVLSASLLLCVFPNPLFAAQSGPRYGGTLRVSDFSDGTSIGYPPKMIPGTSQKHVAPAIESLFRTDKTGKPIPWLATGEINNVAAKTITLPLRKGVKFHDGTDFNAEAVKWNLDQCKSARTGGTEKFRSIDVIDDYTVRINLTEWDSTVTSNLAQIIGMIISPTAYKKNGEEWCANHPIGTGPFQFVSWEKDVRTTFKKFDGYWQKGKPYLERIEWKPIADTLTRQFSLRKGELDLVMTIAMKDLAGLEKDGYVVIRRKAGSGARSLVPDSANPNSPFADVRVRQAAQHAIDNEAIVKAIFYGEAEPANQWIYKGHWAYNPSVVGYPYNPTKAKQLMTEAGYPNGFKTKILYITAPENDQLYTAVQGYLKAVGIDAQLDTVTNARWNQIALGGGKWEGLMMGGLLANPDVTGALLSRYSGGRYYTSMLVPDDYLKAIQNAINAPDFETKQKWTQEVMKLMIDKYCLHIILCCLPFNAVSQPYLHNHGFYETPNTAWWTPEEAWLEK